MVLTNYLPDNSIDHKTWVTMYKDFGLNSVRYKSYIEMCTNTLKVFPLTNISCQNI